MSVWRYLCSWVAKHAQTDRWPSAKPQKRYGFTQCWPLRLFIAIFHLEVCRLWVHPKISRKYYQIQDQVSNCSFLAYFKVTWTSHLNLRWAKLFIFPRFFGFHCPLSTRLATNGFRDQTPQNKKAYDCSGWYSSVKDDSRLYCVTNKCWTVEISRIVLLSSLSSTSVTLQRLS